MLIRPIVGIFLLGVHACAAGQSVKILGMDILEAGIYEARTVRTEAAAGSVSGQVNLVQAPRLLEYTSKIRAKVGTRFGYRYLIRGVPVEYVSLRWLVRYPPPGLLNPRTGEFVLHSETEVRVLVGSTSYNDFSMDHEYELIAGEWIFEMFHEKEKLSEHRFTIVLE